MAATIKDVSGMAGVAPSTVSYVLSGKAAQMKISKETEEKVFYAARSLNYRANLIAKNLRRKATRTIGIVFNDLFSSWANEVMAGVNDMLLPQGYQPLLGITFFNSERERKILNTFLDNQVEALIIQPNQDSADFYRRLSENSDIPLVFVGEGVRELSAKEFMLDGEAAGEAQVRHLYSLGHRKIALFTSDYVSVQSSLRIDGAMKAIRELGLEFPSGYLRTTRNMSPEQDINETMAMMRMASPPTAVAVVNDTIALRVMSGLSRADRNDVAVIGIGNLPESSYDMIDLSSIAEMRQEIGAAAGKYLMEVLSGRHSRDNETVLFHGSLLARSSTLGRSPQA